MRFLISSFIRQPISGMCIILLSLSSIAWPQKLVQDSLILQIKAPAAESTDFSCRIDSVLDLRPHSKPRILTIDEINHYNFIPVDLLIEIPRPLAEMTFELLSSANLASGVPYYLGIQHLELSNHSFFILFKKYRINALVTFFKSVPGDSSIPQGELIFDSAAKNFFMGSTLQKGYEKALTGWLTDLRGDVSLTTQFLAGERNAGPYNWRPYRPHFPWMQINAGSDVAVITDGFMADLHLHFTYPEARRSFTESFGTIRYRHQVKYEAIEYGVFNYAVNYRVNPTFLLQAKSNLFIGVNRWNDMRTVKHELYDALLGDFSINQAVHYHPRFARTLWLGCGLVQTVYYIYSQGIQFRLGAVMQIGFQL